MVEPLARLPAAGLGVRGFRVLRLLWFSRYGNLMGLGSLNHVSGADLGVGELRLLTEIPRADHIPFMQGRGAAAPRLLPQAAAARSLEPEVLGSDALAPASSAAQAGAAVPAADVEGRVVLADAIVLRALGSLDGRELLDLNLRVHGPPT